MIPSAQATRHREGLIHAVHGGHPQCSLVTPALQSPWPVSIVTDKAPQKYLFFISVHLKWTYYSQSESFDGRVLKLKHCML